MDQANLSKQLKVVIRSVLNDELQIVRQYKSNFGKLPNLTAPITFNEKIQSQKLYNRDPRMTQLADKYLVRDYISSLGYENILNELIAVHDTPEDIDFNKLPEQFVIKCNHSWATNIICPRKSELNWGAVVDGLKMWLRDDHYEKNREWAYKDIKPKIIIEKYLSGDLKDYKFFCFSGTPAYVQIDRERFSGHTLDIYDMAWNRLDCTKGRVPNQEKPDPRPAYFDEMHKLAKIISSDFNFCRVDFLATTDNFYFGEVTFYPGGGLTPFEPHSYDREFGAKFDITGLTIPFQSKVKIKIVKAMDQAGLI